MFGTNNRPKVKVGICLISSALRFLGEKNCLELKKGLRMVTVTKKEHGFILKKHYQEKRGYKNLVDVRTTTDFCPHNAPTHDITCQVRDYLIMNGIVSLEVEKLTGPFVMYKIVCIPGARLSTCVGGVFYT